MEEKGYNMGKIFTPFRLTLVGALAGPHLFDISEVIGKEETVERIYRAIDVLSEDNQND